MTKKTAEPEETRGNGEKMKFTHTIKLKTKLPKDEDDYFICLPNESLCLVTAETEIRIVGPGIDLIIPVTELQSMEAAETTETTETEKNGKQN